MDEKAITKIIMIKQPNNNCKVINLTSRFG